MDITFNCDQCGQQIVVDGAGAGLATECPKCGQPLTVPSQESPRAEPSASRQCPFCAETIKAQAIVCRYCARDLRITEQQSRANGVQSPPEITMEYKPDWMAGGITAAQRTAHARAAGTKTDSTDSLQGAASLFAFILPPVGFILGIVLMAKGKVFGGVFIVILSVVMMPIVWFLLFRLLPGLLG